MSLPPPLPKSPPPLPPAEAGPLPYAIPNRQARQGVAFSWRLCLWTEAMLIAWMGIMVFVLPRLQDVFRDFKVQTPLVMSVLVDVAKIIYYGGFVVVLAVPVGIGFLGGVLEPAGRRALRMIITLVMAALIVVTVLAIFQPLLTLIDGMSSVKK
jgi:hypothetical protein